MPVEPNTGRAWLSSLRRFGIRPGLERTRRVLAYFGNPQNELQFYHVAGTNGKGSVCANLYQLLQLRGRVGLFTSPAFDGYQGRFVVDDEVIKADDFEQVADTVREAVRHVTREDPLTEFEVLTVMAILYFRQHAVDAVVWETGLGGRYDSTNVVMPAVAAITNVGLDHVAILGPTIRHIAADKSGIIKESRPVVTAATEEGLDVIERVAKAQHAALYLHGVQFGFVRRGFSVTKSYMDYRGIHHDWFGLEIPLAGMHQCQNSAVALAMLELAMEQGMYPELSVAEVRTALARVVWPGRCEVHELDGMLTVFDGAHNPDAARVLARTLEEISDSTRPAVRQTQGTRQTGTKDRIAATWTLVVGVLADKDVTEILQPILPLASRVIAVQSQNPRALPAIELAGVVRALRPQVPVETSTSVTAGLKQALGSLETEAICCFGSLYTVDEARKAMETMRHSGKQGR